MAWRRVQTALRAGNILDIFPYGADKRLLSSPRQALLQPMSDRRLGKTPWQGKHALQLPRQVQVIGPDQELSDLMAQTQKHVPLTLVLLDWSQAGRLSAPLCHPLIAPKKICAYANNLLTRFGKSVRCFMQKNHLEPSDPERSGSSSVTEWESQ